MHRFVDRFPIFLPRGGKKKERRKERGASFLELVTTREEGGCPGCKRRNGARKTDASRRVVPRVRLLHPLERSGATVVERVTSGRVQCLAMTPARSIVQGKGEWPSPLAPLIRSCRAATRFTFASRRHCGSPSPEGGTANTFLGTCTPTPCTLPHARRVGLVSSIDRPFFFLLLTKRITRIRIRCRRSFFFFFSFFLERINHDSLLSKSWRGLSSISISKLFCKRSNKYVYSNRAT